MKFIKLVILLSSIAFLFAGCSSKTDSSSANGSSESGVTKITMADYFTDDRRNNEMERLIKEFEKSHSDIDIERTAVPYTEHLPKSLRQAKSDTLPTILLVDNLNIPAMVEAGALAPMSDYGEIDESQYFKGTLDTVRYEDKLYGIPFGSNDLALFYNKTMLENAGLEPPKTWSELLSTSKELTEGSTYGIAFSAPNNQQATWQFSPFLWSNEGSFLNYESPESIEALQLWGDLVKEGGASPSVVNFSQTQVYNEFAAKRAAMMVMGPWMLGALNETDIEYGVVPLPTPKEGQPSISPIGGEDLTITTSASAEQQQAAWTFIQWLQDEERLPEVDKFFGYIPAYKPAYEEFVANNPDFKVFADVLQNARALTAETGAKFPEVSSIVASSIQNVLTGAQSAEEAVKDAQAKIDQAVGD